MEHLSNAKQLQYFLLFFVCTGNQLYFPNYVVSPWCRQCKMFRKFILLRQRNCSRLNTNCLPSDENISSPSCIIISLICESNMSSMLNNATCIWTVSGSTFDDNGNILFTNLCVAAPKTVKIMSSAFSLVLVPSRCVCVCVRYFL